MAKKSKKSGASSTSDEINVIAIPQRTPLDPESLWTGYRRWQEQAERETRPGTSLAGSAFRSAILSLRDRVKSHDPIFRSSALAPLNAPAFPVMGGIGSSVQSELWRRQALINDAICRVVNGWPEHAESLEAQCWLRDDILPLIDKLPVAARSHRARRMERVLARGLKSAAAISIAALERHTLTRIAELNRVILSAMIVLVSPEHISNQPLDSVVAELLQLYREMPRATSRFGIDGQMRFLHRACLSIAALLLPGEAVLDVCYEEERTRREAERSRQLSNRSVAGKVTFVLAGEACAAAQSIVETLKCQSGDWECFAIATSKQRVVASSVPALSLQEIRRRAAGDVIVLVTEKTRFSDHSINEFLSAAVQEPDAIWYSDHDCVSERGYEKPFYKPDWSPDLFCETNYVGGVVLLPRALFLEWSAKLEQIDSMQLSLLLLSVGKKQEGVRRIPQVLWHRATPDVLIDSDGHFEAVTKHLSAQTYGAKIEGTGSSRRLRYAVKSRPKVSIVVPFRDKPELLHQLWTSIESHETYDAFELLLVSNNSKNPATWAYLKSIRDSRVRVSEWNHPFNYQTINNVAVRQWATGDYILFLNNDVSWNSGGVIEEMLGHAQRPEIGGVGVNLLFPSGRLQHAGVALGLGGFAAHPFAGCRPDVKWTAFGLPSWVRNPSAVTGACMMMRRKVFDEVGGFDERFTVSGGDVDLSLRIIERGYRLINTPHVNLTHHESATRRGQVIPDDDAWLGFRSMAKMIINGDPAYNPNLTLVSQDCLPLVDRRSGNELAMHLLANVLPSSRAIAG